MVDHHVDPDAVLAELKDFQRRTAIWAFERMFADENPSLRFLVADEVGLGKTHIAKGVIAQVIDHLQKSGDERHDILYICSNGAIARQNLRKLVPKGIELLEDVERLTMLPLVKLNTGKDGKSGVNLLAITPGTSLKFGHSTGKFPERCLAYTFLRAEWGEDVMNARARWVFWSGVSSETGDERLRTYERQYRRRVQASAVVFSEKLAEVERIRTSHGLRPLRELFDGLVEGLRWKRRFPDELWSDRTELIGEIRRVMAIVGIAALQPDLVVLDEFQRFKDLLNPDPENFAAELAQRLFTHKDPETGRPTRCLLLSATPYRMYSTEDEVEGDHYKDFVSTCSFLFSDPARVAQLQHRFNALRGALGSPETLSHAEAICTEIGSELRSVMARTERLAATPDRDGMLRELEPAASVEVQDLQAYMRVASLAEAVKHHDPAEYWKAGPYLVNFMEHYQLKKALDGAAAAGLLPDGERLDPGPGLLSWKEIQKYQLIDPENGKLRWLLEDLERHRAFELLWMPPSLRYYDAGSVYESDNAVTFTKRLIFSGWALVPKVVSCLVSYEAERRAYGESSHRYSAKSRGGQRLTFATTDRRGVEARDGEAGGKRRPASMTAFALSWPSPTLAELGDPRPSGSARPDIVAVREDIERRVAGAIAGLVRHAATDGVIDQRWYWAAPLLLDDLRSPDVTRAMLADDAASRWAGDVPGENFLAHMAEARAMLDYGVEALGRPPEDLVEALAELALGGPAQCALRSISSVVSLPVADVRVVSGAARVASGFRSFFNAPEVTAIVGNGARGGDNEGGNLGYWRDVLHHAADGNLQAVLDEHAHVLRDWLGHLRLDTDERQASAAKDVAQRIAEALETRTSSFRVDIPRSEGPEGAIKLDRHRMRTRFGVAFGNQALDDGGEARIESVSNAFNSPFWPFVLTSTSVGQEGLDFHLWCHAVVHWNLPRNPVDLEQREGRVHRYKGHAVRRNIAATVGSDAFRDGLPADSDPWETLFRRAAELRTNEDEMVPYWVFPEGPASIERHVPVLPFSKESVELPQLRKTLAAYRLAFGQPRQEELLEFLGADRSDEELLELASRLRIDLSPPVRST